MPFGLALGRPLWLIGLLVTAAGPGCDQRECGLHDWLSCECPDGKEGRRWCTLSGDGYEPCHCPGDPATDAGAPADSQAPDALAPDAASQDAAPDTFCTNRVDGTHCDGSELVICQGEAEADRTPCNRGCDDAPAAGSHACSGPEPDFCAGKMDGLWCDGDDLVMCVDGQVASWETCPAGCTVMPVGTADKCAAAPFCTAVPDPVEVSAPTSGCNYMDWNLSEDGFYLISQFGTSNDSTTWGNSTSCGLLQGHYNYHQCRYDVHNGGCLDSNYAIPHVQGHVDYDYQTVLDLVDAYAPASVPQPEYFYVACAQRFNCGTLMRVSNPVNGRCVVVYTEDGGPGVTYEGPSYGGRRILDSSPAVVRFLAVTRIGWASSDMVFVEWGLPGDAPGEACVPCQSTAALAGNEGQRTPWDLNHMMSGLDCR